MKHFIANLVAMFFVSKKLRRRIRSKIMGNNIKPNFPVQPDEQKISDDFEKKSRYTKLKSEWLEHNNGEPPLPGRFSEYDLILPIGPTCHVSMILDYFKLRRFSSPFEWTGGMEPENWYTKPGVYRDSRFREKISAISNNFKNWLNPDDFQLVSKGLPSGIKHHQVVNTKTKIQYTHEFPSNQDLMQYMPEFINKTKRRINHLYNAIEQSDKILILWISCIWAHRARLEKNISDKDIKWAINQIKKIYPNKKFDFVFFESDGTKKRFEYEKIKIAQNAFRIKSNHFLIDSEYDVAHVPVDKEHPYVHVISEMLDNIHLSENAFALPNKEEKNKNSDFIHGLQT